MDTGLGVGDPAATTVPPGETSSAAIGMRRSRSPAQRITTASVVHVLLYAPADNSGVQEAKLTHGAREERRAALAGLDENESHLGPHDLDRDPWDSGARSEIEKRSERRGKDLQKEQAVQKKILDDPRGFAGANEAL